MIQGNWTSISKNIEFFSVGNASKLVLELRGLKVIWPKIRAFAISNISRIDQLPLLEAARDLRYYVVRDVAVTIAPECLAQANFLHNMRFENVVIRGFIIQNFACAQVNPCRGQTPIDYLDSNLLQIKMSTDSLGCFDFKSLKKVNGLPPSYNESNVNQWIDDTGLQAFNNCENIFGRGYKCYLCLIRRSFPIGLAMELCGLSEDDSLTVKKTP